MAAGVIGVLTPENRYYYTIEDVMAIMGCSQSKASTMIVNTRRWGIENKLLFADDIPQGKVPKKVFNMRYGL